MGFNSAFKGLAESVYVV